VCIFLLNFERNYFKKYCKYLVRQVLSIQYQLSNLKYVNDGWTVRLPSPIEFEDVSDSEEEADVLVPASIPSAAIKVILI
jgi:hypothetical protein